MNQETNTEIKENEIFYYKDSNGKVLYTPNKEFALIQARNYETYNVFVEKN